jgi:hypothetical protein
MVTQEEYRILPFFPTGRFPFVASVFIVSYASAQITIGVSCFLIYVLEQLGVIVV